MIERDVTNEQHTTFGILGVGEVFATAEGLRVKAYDTDEGVGNALAFDGSGTWTYKPDQKVVRVEIVSIDYKQL